MALEYCWPQRRIGTRLQAGLAGSSREAAVRIRDFEGRSAEGLEPVNREQVFFIRLLQKIPRVRAWWYRSIDLDEL